MRRIVLALAVSAITVASIFIGTAAASGPAAPGKELTEIECPGLGLVTVSTPKQGHGSSKSVGQIVGEKGHGLPVSFTFTAFDVTTATVVFAETEQSAPGRARSDRTTTTCTGIPFEAPASVFFESHELPSGVAPTDTIRANFEAQVIVKP
jgi:hypothetical protein